MKEQKEQPEIKLIEVKLTADVELLIQKTVENQLKDLPASTYQQIEKLIEDKVVKAEKVYYKILGWTIPSLLLAGLMFFRATSQNASEKVSEAIAKSAVGEKLKDVEKNYAQIQNIKNQVDVVCPEALTNASKITAIFRELESQDNLVRMSADGNLVLNLQDGDLRLRRKNTDKEITIKINNDGQFRFFEGTNAIVFTPKVKGTTENR